MVPTDVRREHLEPHQCCCVTITSDGEQHHCTVKVFSPDAPFCGWCADRHPYGLPAVVEVTAELPARRNA